MRSVIHTVIAGGSLFLLAATAHGEPVTLDFNAFQIGEEVGTYYTGGRGSAGTGPGPNLGLTFESGNKLGTVFDCKTPCFQGQDNPHIGKVLGVGAGGLVIHTPLGFHGTVEFDAALESGDRAGVSVRTADVIRDPGDFVDGTMIDNRAVNPPGCHLLGCPLVHYAINMDAGDVGRAIEFGFGFAPDALFIKNLHFSDLVLPTATPPVSSDPAPVPVWMLVVSGLGFLSAALLLLEAMRSRSEIHAEGALSRRRLSRRLRRLYLAIARRAARV